MNPRQLKEKTITLHRFSRAGRIRAEELIDEIRQYGVHAKIDTTWQDEGAGVKWETVMVYSNYLKMWYQALSPADFKRMNAGYAPRDYERIIHSAKQK